MPKPRRLLFLTIIFIFGVLVAQTPKTFTTKSAKTYVTITIHPNEDGDDQGDDNDDQGEDNKNQESLNSSPTNFNLFNWLKSLFS